jgi:hypothetical protein
MNSETKLLLLVLACLCLAVQAAAPPKPASADWKTTTVATYTASTEGKKTLKYLQFAGQVVLGSDLVIEKVTWVKKYGDLALLI